MLFLTEGQTEGMTRLIDAQSTSSTANKVYIVLTDTGTGFSKLSKFLTRHPYNHVSISFTETFEEVYTFALTNSNGKKGGFKLEDRSILKGSRFTLYSIKLDAKSFAVISAQIEEYRNSIAETSYNHLALFNSILEKDLFDTSDPSKMICSQFVIDLFKSVGIDLLPRSTTTAVKPYEIIRSKFLKFEKRGTV